MKKEIQSLVLLLIFITTQEAIINDKVQRVVNMNIFAKNKNAQPTASAISNA